MTAVPFTIDVPQAVLDDLQRRLQATRWIDDLNDPGWSHGLSIPYMRELVAYWHSAFDWRAQEDSLNGFPNFRTDVKGGQIIHFIHEQGKGPDPLPILKTCQLAVPLQTHRRTSSTRIFSRCRSEQRESYTLGERAWRAGISTLLT